MKILAEQSYMRERLGVKTQMDRNHIEGKMDFEYYDERCHFRPDTVMDIYVPIVKR